VNDVKLIKEIAKWAENQNVQILSENELLRGELSAVIFVIGDYIVRSSQRVYKVPEYRDGLTEDDYNVPADKQDIDSVSTIKSTNFGGHNPSLDFWVGELYISKSTAIHRNDPKFWDIIGYEGNGKLRITHEISATHNADPHGVFSGKFKIICQANYPDISASDFPARYGENVASVHLKKEGVFSNKPTSLCVSKCWWAFTANGRYCYELTPQGIVEQS